MDYPLEISFGQNGKINSPTSQKDNQFYYYSYAEPYITVIMPLHPAESDVNPVADLQLRYNLCHLTVNAFKCDATKCKNSEGMIGRCVHYAGYSYRFLGKIINDSTMNLQMILTDWDKNDPKKLNYEVVRDVNLIRKK